MELSSSTPVKSEFHDIFGHIQLDESWKSRSGRGVKVAVIDSGIDVSHPLLQGKVAESVEAVAEHKRVVFVPSDAGDSAGHGTACAGIISSIAPEAELYSIKVLGAGGLGAPTALYLAAAGIGRGVAVRLYPPLQA